MNRIKALNWLIPLIAILALAAALAGLFWQSEGSRISYTTLRGQNVEIYGQGLYRNDTVFFAATFQALDVLTLVVGLPLLVISFQLYRRGSLRGGWVLAGALSYFLYNGASMAFATAYNPMFLVYTGLFSTSLFAFISTLTMFDLKGLAKCVSPHLPHRVLAIFLFFAGIGMLFLWSSELIPSLAAGETPENLGPYTTMYTHGFDLAVLMPTILMTGVLILKRNPLGYLLAVPLLVLNVLIGLCVIGATISQTLAGIVFPVGVYIGMIGSWVAMGAFAGWLLANFLRNVSK